jgi:hypothetical protein
MPILPTVTPALPCQPVAERVAVESAVVEMGETADMLEAMADELTMSEPNVAANMVAVREPFHLHEVAPGDSAPDEAIATESMEATDAGVAERTVVEAHSAEVTAAAKAAATKAAKATAAKTTTMKTATATKAAATSGKRFPWQ